MTRRSLSAVVAVAAALVATAVPPASAVPVLRLTLYVGHACAVSVECEQETDVLLCRADLLTQGGSETPVSTGVACYGAGPVSMSTGGTPGSTALGVALVTAPFGSPLCVEGVATYLVGAHPVTMTAGPVCRAWSELPSLEQAVTDVVKPLT